MKNIVALFGVAFCVAFTSGYAEEVPALMYQPNQKEASIVKGSLFQGHRGHRGRRGHRGHRGSPGSVSVSSAYAFASYVLPPDSITLYAAGNTMDPTQIPIPTLIEFTGGPSVSNGVDIYGSSMFMIVQAGDYSVDYFMKVMALSEEPNDQAPLILTLSVMRGSSTIQQYITVPDMSYSAGGGITLITSQQVVFNGLQPGDIIQLQATLGDWIALGFVEEQQGEVLATMTVEKL